MTNILTRVKAWQAAKCENSQSNEAYLEFCQQKFYEIRRMMPELIAECERLDTRCDELLDQNARIKQSLQESAVAELHLERNKLLNELHDLQNGEFWRAMNSIGAIPDDEKDKIICDLEEKVSRLREIAIELKAKEIYNQRGWEVLPENDWQSVYYKFKGVSKTTIMYGKRHYREQAERELEAK